jgi:hypothetical protein
MPEIDNADFAGISGYSEGLIWAGYLTPNYFIFSCDYKG